MGKTRKRRASYDGFIDQFPAPDERSDVCDVCEHLFELGGFCVLSPIGVCAKRHKFDFFDGFDRFGGFDRLGFGLVGFDQ